MRRTFDLAAGLVVGGAAVLAVALFLPWYGGDSAWTVFETLDLVLLAAAGAAAGAALGHAGERVAYGAAGLLALVVLSQLVDPPPAGQGADRDAGLWLATVAMLAVVAGTVLARSRIAVRVDVTDRAGASTRAPTPAPVAAAEPEAAPERADRPESLLGFGQPPPEEPTVTARRGVEDQPTQAFAALGDDEPAER